MKKVFLLIFVASFLFTLPAHSQWGTDIADNVILASDGGPKYNVVIEPGPDNSWYITYTDYNDDLQIVHLARVSSSGVIFWDNIIKPPTASGHAMTVMVSDNSDGVIMAWIDYRNPDNPLVYANRIDLDGNKLWGENDLQVGTSEGEQRAPKIIMDGDGGAFITCFDIYTGNDEFFGIYAYRVSSAGTVLWRKYLFPNSPTMNGEQYTISTDGQGGMIAFGTMANTDVTENQIRGMRLDENGVNLWPNETLYDDVSIGKYFQGASAMLDDGEYYMYINAVFHPSLGVYLLYSKYPMVMFGSETEEMGQLIDINGNKLWAEEDILLAEPSTAIEGVDVFLTDHDGNLYFNFGANGKWRLQKVLSDGTLPWTIDGVEYSSNMTGLPDKLALTTDNDVMVAIDEIDDIINVARIDGAGEMVYDPPLLPITVFESGYQQWNPVIRINEHDQVIAVWSEYANANTSDFDLKMHGFYKDGTFGKLTSVRNLQPTYLRIYPNPISNLEELVIQTSEIEFGNVSLIDSNGKVVFVAKNMDFRNGTTTISLPNELSAGLYFLQILNDTRVFSSKLAVY